MKRERVLPILAIGFGLVILCLAAASYLAFRHSSSIQRSSAELVRTHLVTGRLVDDLQEQRLGGVLFRMARLRGGQTESLRREVNGIENEIKRITASAKAAIPSPTWERLESIALELVKEARRILSKTPVEDQDLDEMSRLYGLFVQLSAQIVKEDSQRSAAVEAQIQQQSREMIRESFLLLGGSLLLALACAVVTVRTTNQSFRQMEWQAAELNRVSWHMLEGQEAAARRFSHEMHDELGQSLTGLKAMLLGLKAEDFVTRRRECVKLLDEAIGNVRELSQLLRPVILDDFGLDAGLRWLGERFMDRTHIQVEFSSNIQERLADELETHFFRIAQEALTNVARHSQANKVHIIAKVDSVEVRLIIEDNGKGMSSGNAPRGSSLGMIGMRARARHAGGELSVTSSELGGVRIEAWAPSRKAEPKVEEKDPYFVS